MSSTPPTSILLSASEKLSSAINQWKLFKKYSIGGGGAGGRSVASHGKKPPVDLSCPRLRGHLNQISTGSQDGTRREAAPHLKGGTP